MEKEFESLEKIKEEFGCDPAYYGLNLEFEILEQALTELKQIKEASPTKALKKLERIDDYVDRDYDYCQRGDYDKDYEMIRQTLLKAQEQEREIEILKQIINSFFVKGSPLHQYVDKKFGLTIEVDDDCSIMHLGEFKGVDLDQKLKEVLE